MKIVNMHEAKTKLSRLIEAAVHGEPFVIARAGKPAVKVMQVDQAAPAGFLKHSNRGFRRPRSGRCRSSVRSTGPISASIPALCGPDSGELAIESRHCLALHADPFDRRLLSQAITEGLILLTADAALAAYGGPVEKV